MTIFCLFDKIDKIMKKHGNIEMEVNDVGYSWVLE